MNLKARIRKLFTNVWTVPNVLTMLRLVLVPVFVVLFLKGYKMASLAVFAVASLTDMLDGYLARKLNQITDFGKLFDPLADKLMVLSAMVCHAIAGAFPWSAIIIVACKELIMVLGGVFMLGKGVVVYSNYVGKAAQVCFIAALILAFFHEKLPRSDLPLDHRRPFPHGSGGLRGGCREENQESRSGNRAAEIRRPHSLFNSHDSPPGSHFYWSSVLSPVQAPLHRLMPAGEVQPAGRLVHPRRELQVLLPAFRRFLGA